LKSIQVGHRSIVVKEFTENLEYGLHKWIFFLSWYPPDVGDVAPN